MRVVLIPCGETEWVNDGRLLGRVELTLTPVGEQHAAAWIEHLRVSGLKRIFHSPDELAARTAKILSAALGIPAKADAELAEVDVGLWTGLTDGELKSRFAKAHRQLNETPLNVSPPNGERLSEASERITAAVKKRIKKNGRDAVGLVLRPFALALARAALGELELSDVWEAREERNPVTIQCAQPSAAGGDLSAPA